MKLNFDSADTPVLIPASAALGGQAGFGFEGGRAFIHDDGHHLFTTELLSSPIWAHTAYAHWYSPDGDDWQRVSTLRVSTGDQTGTDQDAALFSPMPIFNDVEDRWQLFFVSYRGLPDTAQEFRRNHHGKVIRATSVVPGPGGLDGPYTDDTVILEPGEHSQPWEGLQGTDSFFPYLTDYGWVGLYGSATTELYGGDIDGRQIRWGVGLARGESLSGPWTREPEGNPLDVEPRYWENPVVTKLSDGSFAAVYENDAGDPALRRSFGLMSSPDGMTWKNEGAVMVPDEPASWAHRIRTPLGLLVDGDRFRIYFTGFDDPTARTAADYAASIGVLTGYLEI